MISIPNNCIINQLCTYMENLFLYFLHFIPKANLSH